MVTRTEVTKRLLTMNTRALRKSKAVKTYTMSLKTPSAVTKTLKAMPMTLRFSKIAATSLRDSKMVVTNSGSLKTPSAMTKASKMEAP